MKRTSRQITKKKKKKKSRRRRRKKKSVKKRLGVECFFKAKGLLSNSKS